MKFKVLEIDGLTGEAIERGATAAEIAEQENIIAELEAQAAAEAAIREAALTKLEALGLTPEELKALIK